MELLLGWHYLLRIGLLDRVMGDWFSFGLPQTCGHFFLVVSSCATETSIRSDRLWCGGAVCVCRRLTRVSGSELLSKNTFCVRASSWGPPAIASRIASAILLCRTQTRTAASKSAVSRARVITPAASGHAQTTCRLSDSYRSETQNRMQNTITKQKQTCKLP